MERNRIKHNGTQIDNSEIEAFIRQRPNRKILKLVRFNLWLYNQIDQEKLVKHKEKRNLRYDNINASRLERNTIKNEKRMAKGKSPKKLKLKDKDKLTFRESLLEAGEAPVILDTILTRITVNQMQKFIFSRGYFDSKVKDSIVIDKKNKRAKLFFSISKSKPYIIKNIQYKIEDPLVEYFVNNDTSLSLIRPNSIYNEEIFQKERERISSNLLNNGYFNFAPEYIYYMIDTNLVGQDVNLTIGFKQFSEPYSIQNDSLVYRNHKRFYVRNVYMISENVPDFKGKANSIYMSDTTVYNELTFLHSKPLKIHKRDLAREISILPSQVYQQSLAEETYKNLGTLKVFKSVFIQYLKNPNYDDQLDCYIICQPVVKQAVTMETEGTNTSGNLGIAGNLVFQNKNTFKGAELVELKLLGSVTAQKQFNSSEQNTTNVKDVRNTFNTYQFGPELNLYIPKPLFPFTLFYYKKTNSEKRFFTSPKTIINLSFNYQSRPEFARTLSNISYGFKFNNNNQLFTYQVIPLEIYSVKANLFGNFKNELLDLNDFFLLNSFQNHLTTLSKLSVAFNNQSISKKRTLAYLKVDLSSSGNILRGFYDVTNQPKDSLGRYNILNVPFSQFLKLQGDFRFYLKIRKTARLVYRISGGVAKPLTNLTTLPYEQSFFSGGPNSVMAWRSRTLGPGGYSQPDSVNARYDKIGDIQLESNVEYRFHIIKSFYGAWFLDAGNIWTASYNPNKPDGQFKANRFYKEIAIGSGFGLRYDFSFFVLRLDAAFRIVDPQYAEGDRWTFDKKPLRTTVLNFGIGYPF